MMYHGCGFWRFWTSLLAGLALSLAFSLSAFAKDNPSVTQVGRNISISPGQKVGELTCFGEQHSRSRRTSIG